MMIKRYSVEFLSMHIGKLYCSSRRMLPGWNRLLRRYRHLRHLQVRTPEDDEIWEEDDQQQETNDDNDQTNNITPDPSLLSATLTYEYQEICAIASQLFYVYRQEMLELLSLYGLSNESDLWCRKSMSRANGELEDTAYNQLKQLVARTRYAFFLRLVSFCPSDRNSCNSTIPFDQLCAECRRLHNSLAVALYQECYSGQNGLERAPVLSLPWLFTTALLKTSQRELTSTKGLLSVAMESALHELIRNCSLRLSGQRIKFRTSKNYHKEADVDWTVCAFVEIVHYCLKPKDFTLWPTILTQFILKIKSFERHTSSLKMNSGTDEWLVVFDDKQNKLYAGILMSMEWTETEDELIHSYFDELLEICFVLGQNTANGNDEYLRISEEIILILQQVAIDGIPWTQNQER